jgi:hypothetical protein
MWNHGVDEILEETIFFLGLDPCRRGLAQYWAQYWPEPRVYVWRNFRKWYDSTCFQVTVAVPAEFLAAETLWPGFVAFYTPGSAMESGDRCKRTQWHIKNTHLQVRHPDLTFGRLVLFLFRFDLFHRRPLLFHSTPVPFLRLARMQYLDIDSLSNAA